MGLTQSLAVEIKSFGIDGGDNMAANLPSSTNRTAPAPKATPERLLLRNKKKAPREGDFYLLVNYIYLHRERRLSISNIQNLNYEFRALEICLKPAILF